MDIVDPRIERYADEHSSPEPEHLRALAAETREKMAASGMIVRSPGTPVLAAASASVPS